VSQFALVGAKRYCYLVGMYEKRCIQARILKTGAVKFKLKQVEVDLLILVNRSVFTN